ncbi:uncharacterized protein LOC143911870 [Arctopsyche grandis]|uniref:uncharacterized protein LOC143911870 n=1 Tax=Arctopsyche grandis TaxID=121162 RepID=UPI00406DA38A
MQKMAETDSTATYNELKEKLIGLGLFEGGMTIKDMLNLLAAVENSYYSANEEMRSRDIKVSSVTTGMKRHYISVLERRMPWSLFPIPEELSVEQRAQILAAYKEQQSVSRYRKSKCSLAFSEWSSAFNIPLSKTKMLTDFQSASRQSRSGRLLKSTPHYVDDGSDTESSYAKKKMKKKMKKLSNDEIIAHSSLFRDAIVDIEKETKSKISAVENKIPKNDVNNVDNFSNNYTTIFNKNDILDVDLNTDEKSHSVIEDVKKDTLNARNRPKRLKMSAVE